MNILYISPMVIDRNNLDGVGRKILYQVDAFKSYEGVEKVYLASYFEGKKYLVTGEDIEILIPYKKRSSKQLELLTIYPQISDICRKLSIDVVYFRIFALSWASDRLFRILKSQGIKIAVEIPTYPFWKEKWMDVYEKFCSGKILTAFKRTATNLIHFLYAHRLKKYIQIIVTFSNIDNLWGVPVIGIANGYNFKQIEEEKNLKASDQSLHLLMVASIRRNHGADRVIRGLSEYYKSSISREVYFHIVGDGEAVPELKQLTIRLGNVKDYVIFHGFKAGLELDEVYKYADIGISAIAFHRLGVHFASPLKSKEYFAKGIPVVGTTAEQDVLNCSSKNYYYAITEDDSEVRISEVCDFYDKLCEKGWTNKKIALDANKNFSWKSIMKPVYDSLC